MKIVTLLNNTGEGFPIESKRLREEPSVELRIHPFTSEQDIIRACQDAYIVGLSDARITKKVIDSLHECRLIIRYGVGVDNIDLDAARARDIFVCNAPSYGTIDVAEHAFGLIITLSRQTKEYDERLRSGNWAVRDDFPTFRLSGKTLGLVGFGRIARSVCVKAVAFGMHVLVYDPFIKKESVNSINVESSELNRLFEQSDIVSLHLPLSTTTEHFVDSNLLRRMKRNAIIINTSRGKLIDMEALVDCLVNERIAGAGLDVFPEEPFAANHPLLKMEHTVLTPHIAWFSHESIIALHEEVTDDMIRVLRNEAPINRVI
ncbi:MAG: C-terminal binding protein [Sphaerochaetaceae bacterium]|nr:C-terminal binding protein [Sphaerochaetaceae bacterium]